MKKSYAGKINGRGTESVSALFPKTAGKQPKVKTGTDLRVGKGKK